MDWTWLRWCDGDGNWLLTDTEIAEQRERQARVERDQVLAQLQEERALREELLRRLRQQGGNGDDLLEPDDLPGPDASAEPD